MSAYGQNQPGYTCHHCLTRHLHMDLYLNHWVNNHPNQYAFPAGRSPNNPNNDFTSFHQPLASFFPRNLPIEMGLFPPIAPAHQPGLLLDAQGQVLLGPGPKFAQLKAWNMPNQIYSGEEGWKLVMYEAMNPGCDRQDFADRMYGSGTRGSQEEKNFKNMLVQRMTRYRSGSHRNPRDEGRLKNFLMLPQKWRSQTSRPKLNALDALTPQQIQLQVIWDIGYHMGNPVAIRMPTPTDLCPTEVWTAPWHLIPAANFSVQPDARLQQSLQDLTTARRFAAQANKTVADLTQSELHQLGFGGSTGVARPRNVVQAQNFTFVPIVPAVGALSVPVTFFGNGPLGFAGSANMPPASIVQASHHTNQGPLVLMPPNHTPASHPMQAPPAQLPGLQTLAVAAAASTYIATPTGPAAFVPTSSRQQGSTDSEEQFVLGSETDSANVADAQDEQQSMGTEGEGINTSGAIESGDSANGGGVDEARGTPEQGSDSPTSGREVHRSEGNGEIRDYEQGLMSQSSIPTSTSTQLMSSQDASAQNSLLRSNKRQRPESDAEDGSRDKRPRV